MSGDKIVVLKTFCTCYGCVSRMKKVVQKIDDFHVISVDKENNLILVMGTINKNSLKKLKKKLKPNVYIVPFNDGTAGGEEERVVEGGGSREERNSDAGRDYAVYNGGGSAGEIEIVENWVGGDVEYDSNTNTCSIQ